MTCLIAFQRLDQIGEQTADAQVRFVRKDEFGKYHTIYAGASGKQWGAKDEILNENASEVQRWLSDRKNYYPKYR